MGDGSRGAVWFGASGFELLSVHDDEDGLVLEVETSVGVVGCSGCGTRGRAKDRRWVTLADTPVGGTSVTVRWRKRIWSCPETACVVKTWTEQASLAAPRQVITARAQRWAVDQLAAVEATVASLARRLRVTWSTVWAAVVRIGETRVDDGDRVAVTAMIGFDETVMSPASRRRRRRFVTAAVDVTTGQIVDVFEGRDAKHLQTWMAVQDPGWLAKIEVVSVDPHEGYRSAICAEGSPLADVTVVVDPFHIVRLANQAVTKCRQRVQNETLQHRGQKGDPLYGIRKVLLMGAERLDERGWERLHAGLNAGDPDDSVADCWVAKEKVRDVYLTEDPEVAAGHLDDAIDWCIAEQSSPELATLAKTLRRWHPEILARHTTGASNGRVEAANLLIKAVKRSGRGFRNLHNYRLRILLAGGQPPCQTQPATRIRTRRPRLVA